MHDDDRPMEPEPDAHDQRPWTEAQWEAFMLENERLMDRYQRVWEEEHPERSWTDPLDLYYKVHYDLDSVDDPEDASPESEAEPEDLEPSPVQPPARDELEELAAYKLAMELATATLDLLKRLTPEGARPDPFADALALHALRIGADIAGGHGLGHEDDTLCGNIVKNRWALEHARQAKRLFAELAARDGATPELTRLLALTAQIIPTLEARIAELRSKVWWDDSRRHDRA